MDIKSFLDRHRAEYERTKSELDTQREENIAAHNKAGGININLFPDQSIFSEEERWQFESMGMSDGEINDLEFQLQEVSVGLPPRPGCLPFESIFNYIEQSTSELDNKHIYMHLEKCSECRQTLFEKSWFMLEP